MIKVCHSFVNRYGNKIFNGIGATKEFTAVVSCISSRCIKQMVGFEDVDPCPLLKLIPRGNCALFRLLSVNVTITVHINTGINRRRMGLGEQQPPPVLCVKRASPEALY